MPVRARRSRARTSHGRWLVLAAALGLASGAASAQPTRPAGSSDVAQAEAHFFTAQKLYVDEKYHEALAEFRTSYELSPSPNSLLYVARCYRELGQPVISYDTYGKVIAESAGSRKYAATHKAAREEQAEVAPKVGRVVVVVPSDVTRTRVRVGYKDIDASQYDKELTVEAGNIAVHAEAQGHKPFDWQGVVAAGETKRVSVEFVPLEVAKEPHEDKDKADAKKDEPPGPGPIQPMRTLAYVSAGIGVAGIATWAIFGVAASNRYDDLRRQCDGRCSPALQPSVDAGRRETTASTVGMIVGFAGLGGGVALWILSRPKSGAPPQTTGIVVGMGGGPRLTMGGDF